MSVNGSGRIAVSSGGTATELAISDGALLDFTVTSDTLIVGTSNGSAFEIKNGLVSNYSVNSGGMLNISAGGQADNVTVNRGIMYVDTTGTVNNTTLNRGTIYVYDEGVANNITVSSGTLSVMDQGLPRISSFSLAAVSAFTAKASQTTPRFSMAASFASSTAAS
ncbi:MAG: AIDA repeat-containing protein [Victivallales bacterium]|nr:AIDA repeat-containing protein [Victivallales bacterium]